MAAIGEADDLIAATLPFDEGLAPYLRALGTGMADLDVAPVDPSSSTPPDSPF